MQLKWTGWRFTATAFALWLVSITTPDLRTRDRLLEANRAACAAGIFPQMGGAHRKLMCSAEAVRMMAPLGTAGWSLVTGLFPLFTGLFLWRFLLEKAHRS